MDIHGITPERPERVPVAPEEMGHQLEERRISWHRAGPEHPIAPPHHPIPPHHKRRDLLQVTFDENDWEVFKEVFQDEDTAIAATEILRNAPPEIQLLAIQVMKMIEEAA